MKKFIIIIIALILCDAYFITARNSIKAFEKDRNEIFLEYESSKEKFTVTRGKITEMLPPRSERSAEEDHNLGNFGTYGWKCYIEFETSDGRTITDRFFPADHKDDYVGKDVDVAYYVLNDIGQAVVAARTEYIPDSYSLGRNTLCIAVISIGIAVTAVLLILRQRKGGQSY